LAFVGCTSLTYIYIPDSVTFIGFVAFAGCTSLTAIDVSNSNTNYSSDRGILYNKDKTFLQAAPGGITGSLTIPNSVTTIAEWAFRNCTNLTSVTIPNSVTIIQPEAFSYCTSLTSVTIPNSVTIIQPKAFSYCTGLTSVTIGSGVTSIGWGAFERCTGLTSVTFTTGSNINNFGEIAFPEGNNGVGGDSLMTAYSIGKAGTYKRATGGSTWRKQ